MAALTALPLSMGMRDLEDRAEREDARQYAEAVKHHNGDTADIRSEQYGSAASEPASSAAADGSSSGPSASSSSPARFTHREYTAAFFHPRVLLVFVLGCLVPMIYIYLYVGALWNPQSRIYHAQVDIFNFDAGIDRAALIAAYQLNATGQAALARLLPTDNVGALFGDTMLYTNSTAGLFDWHYCDVSNCSYASYDDVRSAVDRGDLSAWYSLVIPANYTLRYLQQALNLYSLSQLNDDIAQLVADDALPDPTNGTYNNVRAQPSTDRPSAHSYSTEQSTLTCSGPSCCFAVSRWCSPSTRCGTR